MTSTIEEESRSGYQSDDSVISFKNTSLDSEMNLNRTESSQNTADHKTQNPKTPPKRRIVTHSLQATTMNNACFADRLTIDLFTSCDRKESESPDNEDFLTGQLDENSNLIHKPNKHQNHTETVLVVDVLNRIEEKGIDVYHDPRCKPLLSALQSKSKLLAQSEPSSPNKRSKSSAKSNTLGPLRERVSRDELIEIVRSNTGFLKHVFDRGLIIVNWPHFKSRIESMYTQLANSCRGIGNVADYIPQLAKVNPEYWGVSITTIDGQRLNLGDTDIDFTVQSCSKVISYCIAQEQNGPEFVHKYVGREPSGEQFNALKLDNQGRPHNPCINSGAIMTCSLIKTPSQIVQLANKEKRNRQLKAIGFSNAESSFSDSDSDSEDRHHRTAARIFSENCLTSVVYAPGTRKTTVNNNQNKSDHHSSSHVNSPQQFHLLRKDNSDIQSNQVLRDAERFEYVCGVWKDLLGDKPNFNNPVYLSERATGHRNFALAHFMKEQTPGFPPHTDIAKNLEFYFQCCSLEANCAQMSLLAATLANYGTNPVTNKKVFSSRTVQNCLSIMYSCGMYNYSGEHSFEIGIPSKSGVGGCIISVIPGVMGTATFSPRLDDFGNSHQGVEFLKLLSETFGFHTFQKIKQGRSGIGGAHTSSAAPQINVARRLSSVDHHRHHSALKQSIPSENNQKQINRPSSNHPNNTSLASSLRAFNLDSSGDDEMMNDDGHRDSNKTTNNFLSFDEVTGLSRPRSTEIDNSPDGLGVYHCVLSASNGDITTLKQLFVQGRDLTYGDYDSRTPLHLSACNNHLNIVEFLVTEAYPAITGKPPCSDPKQSTINPVDRWGNTPMDDAIREDQPHIVEFLKKYGGVPSSQL